MKVIAARVKTREPQQFPRAEGCDEIQGFFSGRPMSREEFLRTLRSRKALT
jgi:EAL domain-containing protein (putative c-di-GMP-specific phosphodiesterase class I)